MRRPGTFRTSAAAAPAQVPLTSDMPCGGVVLNTCGDHADADAPPFLGLPLSCRGGEPIPSPVETTGFHPTQFGTAGHQKQARCMPTGETVPRGVSPCPEKCHSATSASTVGWCARPTG